MTAAGRARAAAEALRSAFGEPPLAAVVLGSGLGSAVEALADVRRRPYGELGLPPTGVTGHRGEVVVGRLEGGRLAVLSGRVHGYEGRDPEELVRAVRAMAFWGVPRLVLTAATGSLRAELPPGRLVLVRDHLNLMGINPLVGPHDPALGERFVDLSRAYDPELAAQAREVAEAAGIPLAEGVYVALRGPSYETPAEVRMLGALGGDVVGMSTVPEVVALAALGVPVLVLALVANPGAGLVPGPVRHDEVTAVAARAAADLGRLLAGLVARWR